ncbi:hypothetical protein FBU30_007623 [Linnemannia zychae]|nr:hypothetical protein FBU30_007623 [Linnemannia zychae]
MRFTVATVAAAFVAVASAQATNPAYPFEPNGPCVDTCLTTVGKSMLPNFTNDPASPDFMASLALAHERGTPSYTKYMTDTGMCIMKCPQAELDLYQKQYNAKAAWYTERKNGGATPSTTSGTGATPSPSKTPDSGAAANAASALVGVVAILGAAALL